MFDKENEEAIFLLFFLCLEFDVVEEKKIFLVSKIDERSLKRHSRHSHALRIKDSVIKRYFDILKRGEKHFET